MIQLGICAFGAFVITSTAAVAQDVPIAPDPSSRVSDIAADLKTTGGLADDGRLILLGQVKSAPLCPPYCAPRRITSPEQATVGEREVIAFTTTAAANRPKLHVDSSRSTWAQVEKLPSAVAASEVPTVATRNEFRPALDPVLAEPTTIPTE